MTWRLKPHLIEGVPKTITVDDGEIREALSECVSTIMNAIRVALERTPPELSADISDRGIVLTGGALLKNLDKRIREKPACRFQSPTIRYAAWSWVRARCSAISAAEKNFDRVVQYLVLSTSEKINLRSCYWVQVPGTWYWQLHYGIRIWPLPQSDHSVGVLFLQIWAGGAG